MYKLCFVNVSDFLKQKYFELQFIEKRNVTVDEFAKLFGATQPLMSLWMNGKRQPGPEFKERIIERYGDEAILVFGEDPDLYAVINNWDFYSPEERRAFREQAEQKALQNDTKRAHAKRRTRAT